MLPIRKLFSRKSIDQKADNESDISLQENMTRLNRRHSSARSSGSTEGSQGPSTVQSTKLSPRRSVLGIQSPFKSKDHTLRCQNCHKSVCVCRHTGSINTENEVNNTVSAQLKNNMPPDVTTVPLSQPVDVSTFSDENGNQAGNKVGDSDVIQMNGTTSDIAQFDSCSRDQLQKLSVIEKKILSQKQNTLSAVNTRRSVDSGTLLSDTGSHQNSVLQSVPDTDAVARVGSPRLFTKRHTIATRFSRLQQCSSSFSGLSRSSPSSSSETGEFSSQFATQRYPLPYASAASTAFSDTDTSLHVTYLPASPTTMLENQPNLSTSVSDPSSDLSAKSTDTQHFDAKVDRSLHLINDDSTSAGALESPCCTFGISTNSSGSCTTAGSEEHSPVPPPRRRRNRGGTFGRFSYVGDLYSGGTDPHIEGQQISKRTKSRSLSELYQSGEFDEYGWTVEGKDSRSSTLTSGIVSDVHSPSWTPVSSNSSSASACCASNTEQAEQFSSSLPVTSAAISNFENNESRSSMLSTAAAKTPLRSNVNGVDLKSLLTNSILSLSSAATRPLTSGVIEAKTLSASATTTTTTSSSPSSLYDEQRMFGSHNTSEKLSTVTSDHDGSVQPLHTPLVMHQLGSHPTKSLRALRYSSNCVEEYSSYGRPEPEPTSPALVRMTGLSLGHVMTPLRVVMATEKPAAVSDHFSPTVGISEAEISKLADDLTQNDKNFPVDERFVCLLCDMIPECIIL